MKRKLPSLETFIRMLNEHTFSFIPCGDRRSPHSEQLNAFIKRQAQEVEFFEIAWAGGDAYMAHLLSAQSRSFHKELNRRVSVVQDEAVRSADEVASLRYFRTLDPQFQEYLIMLSSHDWTYAYSDDIRAWRAGNESNAKLVELAKKGGRWQEAYDAFKAKN